MTINKIKLAEQIRQCFIYLDYYCFTCVVGMRVIAQNHYSPVALQGRKQEWFLTITRDESGHDRKLDLILKIKIKNENKWADSISIYKTKILTFIKSRSVCYATK